MQCHFCFLGQVLMICCYLTPIHDINDKCRIKWLVKSTTSYLFIWLIHLDFMWVVINCLRVACACTHTHMHTHIHTHQLIAWNQAWNNLQLACKKLEVASQPGIKIDHFSIAIATDPCSKSLWTLGIWVEWHYFFSSNHIRHSPHI